MALALGQIWANKMRGMLTTIGITIGVGAVSAVIALMTGMQENVLEELSRFGANRLLIFPSSPPGKHLTREQLIFRYTDFDGLLANCPSITRFARRTNYSDMSLRFGTRSDQDNVWVLAIDPIFQAIESMEVSEGRLLEPIDAIQARRVCLVNPLVAADLNLNRDPTGQFIDTSYFGRLQVVGLLRPPLGGERDPEFRNIVTPFTFANRQFDFVSYIVVHATCKSAAVAEEAQAEAEFYLRQKRHIKPGQPDNFTVRTPQRAIDQFNRMSSMATLIAGGIAGISLLVAGVGIMNIMLVSVSERTREIGLRKGVGARPGAILMQFLVEAVVLCLLGGALGLVLGQALTHTVVAMAPVEAKLRNILLPGSTIMVAFSFCSIVGLVFGMFPAIKAASLDPIEALRHE
jgi:putative ABC transport system permease protein